MSIQGFIAKMMIFLCNPNCFKEYYTLKDFWFSHLDKSHKNKSFLLTISRSSNGQHDDIWFTNITIIKVCSVFPIYFNVYLLYMIGSAIPMKFNSMHKLSILVFVWMIDSVFLYLYIVSVWLRAMFIVTKNEQDI